MLESPQGAGASWLGRPPSRGVWPVDPQRLKNPFSFPDPNTFQMKKIVESKVTDIAYRVFPTELQNVPDSRSTVRVLDSP